MSNDENTPDGVVIKDRSSRRTFMRRGAAIVAVTGAVSASSIRTALASDCDRGGPGGEKPKHGGNGSDTDTGANADPTGCGRRPEKPKISQVAPKSQTVASKRVKVAKIST